MKLLICVAVVFLFGFIGFGISNYYRERKKFFFELKNLLSTLNTDINFSSKKLNQIFSSNLWCSGDLKKLIENYKSIINSDKSLDKKALFNKIDVLNEQEKESIYLFFKQLGRVDVYNQVKIIESFNHICDEFYIQAKSDSVKYCTLYTKLGVIIGIFVVLLII